MDTLILIGEQPPTQVRVSRVFIQNPWVLNKKSIAELFGGIMNLNLPAFLKKKGILCGGISLYDGGLRLALTSMEGDSVKVLRMEEISVDTENPLKIKKTLADLALPKNTLFGLRLHDPKLRIKRIEVPWMPDREISSTLQAQLLEGLDDNPSEYEIRYTPLNKTTSLEEDLEFMVYGIPTSAVAKARSWGQELGVAVAAGEPSSVSIAAWLETLEREKDPTRGILHLSQDLGEFIGILKGRLVFRESFLLPNSGLQDSYGVENYDSEILIHFQQFIENFTIETRAPPLEHLYLAGDWDQGRKTLIEENLGIPISVLGEEESQWVHFANENLKKNSGKFATELGLSVFPRSSL